MITSFIQKKTKEKVTSNEKKQREKQRKSPPHEKQSLLNLTGSHKAIDSTQSAFTLEVWLFTFLLVGCE